MDMAAVRLIALHANKGKSVAQCLGDRTDYAKNPEKTEKGNLVTAYECDPMTVDEEFMLSKRKYQQITGREQQSDVIAYQIRQSFKPGEITAEEAKSMMEEQADAAILDVREQDEYDAGHIPGAVLLPVGTISEETAASAIPEKDTVVLVYCRSGNRSKTASQALVDLGYTQIYEFGGIKDWPYEVER